MQLPAAARKTALVTHVVTSVGWLGAVAAFLALAVSALRTADADTQRALYIAMDVLGSAALVPLSLASFASGLVQSLGTSWGLFRHWWVVAKLAISVLATGILLLYVSLLPSSSPVLHSAGAVVLLLVAAALSVFKPKGLTRHGWLKQQQQRRAAPVSARAEAAA